MKKIIVPVDFSDDSLKALKLAIYIAEKVQANIQMVHVKKTKTLSSLFKSSDGSLTQSQIEENFHDLIQNIDPKGIIINYTVRQGSVAKEIANYADEQEGYLIIMGTHGASGFEEFWMGSNAYKVVTNSDCPVLTMRGSYEPKGISKIVLPIDGSANTRQKVPFTMELAKFFNAEIHVLAVCTDESDEWVKRITSYTAQVCRFLNEKGVDVVYEFATGNNITDLTIEYAQKIDADLISIMTEQETTIENTFLGPFAQQMVNHSPIPVLSMHNNPALEGEVSII